MGLFRSIALGGAACMLLVTLPAQAAEGLWVGVSDKVIAAIDHGERLALAGKAEEAKSAIVDAYFDVFEEFKMEKAERLHIGMQRTIAVEAMFEELETAAGTPGSTKVHALADKLRGALRHDAKALDKAKIAADGVSKE